MILRFHRLATYGAEVGRRRSRRGRRRRRPSRIRYRRP